MFITKQKLGFYFSIQGEAQFLMLLEIHPQRNPMVDPSRAMIFRCLNPMKYQYPIYDSLNVISNISNILKCFDMTYYFILW